MKLLVFMIFALTIIITPAFAELDLSNEKITSADNRLILQFTENTIQQLRTHTSIISHIEYGIVDLGNIELLLDDARVNVLGDSFTIKNDNIALYAKNIGDGKFRINTYINTNNGLQKNTFTANIVSPEQITTPEYIEPEPTIQMFTWIQQPAVIGEELVVNVKVTDDKINRGLVTEGGGIAEVDITILTGQFGRQLRSDDGITNVYGKYNGGVYLDTEYRYMEYLDITIIAKWNDQYVSEKHSVWLAQRTG